jgi:hypothetical protein
MAKDKEKHAINEVSEGTSVADLKKLLAEARDMIAHINHQNEHTQDWLRRAAEALESDYKAADSEE